jgi:hypothetical protein
MSREWKFTERAIARIEATLEHFRQEGLVDRPIYPSLMWSLGGEGWRNSDPENTRVALPAEYVSGFYFQDPPPRGERLILVAEDRFGFVVFLPSDEDQASDRRLIDHDGEQFLVR